MSALAHYQSSFHQQIVSHGDIITAIMVICQPPCHRFWAKRKTVRE